MKNALAFIQANINPENQGMDIVSITKKGDGVSTFNKTNKGRGANKVLLEDVGGFTPETLESESKFTAFVGGNYEKMANNRIAKGIKTLRTRVELAGGSEAVDMILEGIQGKANEGEAFKSEGLPFGEWVKGWEGVLIEHTDKNGDHWYYLRTYAETNNKPEKSFSFQGQAVDTKDAQYAPFLKPKKKESGKIYELKMALSKIVDVEDPEIKDALNMLRKPRPEGVRLDRITKLTINGETFTP
jgi:hypothetical protein